MAVALIVMAKLPLPGLAKTRLAPALGAEGAARLAERLLRHALQSALRSGLGPVELCLAPHTEHPLVSELVSELVAELMAGTAAQGRLRLARQVDADLGGRMADALGRALREHPAALLFGTDAPALNEAYLQAAAAALDDHDAVFGPVLDGGYVLVGLRRPAPRLFDGMRWSHAGVMRDSRARAAALGLRHHELPLLADIDEPADLVHLPAGWRDAAHRG